MISRFRDPWFLDKPLSFSTNVYKISKEYPDYDKDATGFGMSLGKRFTEYWWAESLIISRRRR